MVADDQSSPAAVAQDGVAKQQVPKDALPLSPPLTDVSAAASTDSSPATISPPQMPAAAAAAAGTPPMSPGASSTHSVASPLPPFPAEVFSNVLSYLSQSDAAPLCRVSRSWNYHISNDARLWSTLVTYLDADEDDMCRAVCLRASSTGGGLKRSGGGGGGGIRALRIVLGSTRDRHGRHVDRWPQAYIVQRVRYVLDLVSHASVSVSAVAHGSTAAVTPPRTCSSLRTLDVELRPNTHTSLDVIGYLGRSSRIPLFRNLREVRFQVAAPDFELFGAWLKMFPSVTTFEFKADPISRIMAALETSSWVWENPLAQGVQSLDHLETLKLSGVFLGELELPTLPALKHLEVHHSHWEGYSIFYLLRHARRTLETVCIDQVEFPPTRSPADDWLEYVHPRLPSLIDPGDVVAPFATPSCEAVPILLPALRNLTVVGPSPPFFASMDSVDLSSSYSYNDDDYYSTPVLCMPNLEHCFLDSVDVETFEEEALAPLAVLGRNAPLVTHLTLNALTVSDYQMHYCLAGMAAKVTTLDLYQSTVTDWLLARLPSLVPSLKVLDVRMCEVTPQGVARLVERIRDLNDEGQSKVEQVLLDPPTRDWAEHAAYGWLDFVGVLKRDDTDPEGDGPPVDDVDARRRWVKEGKRDEDWEYKELVAQLEAAEQERRALEARERAFKASLFGSSSASSSSSSRGGGGGGGQVGPSAVGPSSVPWAPPRSAPAPTSFVPFNPFHQHAPTPISTCQSTPMQHQHPQQQQPLPPHPPIDLSAQRLPPLLPHQQHQRWAPTPSFTAHEQPHTYSPTPRPSAPAPPAALAPRVAPHFVAPAQQNAAIAVDRCTDTPSTESVDELEVDYSFLDDADGGAAHLGADFVRAQQDEFARVGAARDDSVQAQVQAQVEAVAAAIGRGEGAVGREADEEREQGRRDEAQAAAALVLAHQQACAAAHQAHAQAGAVATAVQPGSPALEGPMPVFQGFAGDGDDSTDDDDDDDDVMAPADEGVEGARDEVFEALV
ncbi:hypothetical protein JCM9279_005674 [Rhodotorula babjevae]